MRTGQDVPILDDPHPVTVFIWVTILFHGLLKGRSQSPGHQLKRSTGRLRMLWLNPFGCGNCLPSYIVLSSVPLLSTVTMSLQFIWLPIRFIIGARSTLRSTFILYVRRLPWAKCEFYTFQLLHNLQTSSPRASLLLCSPTYDPVSTSLHPTLRLRGDARLLYSEPSTTCNLKPSLPPRRSR